MSLSYSTLKTNVGNRVIDTSTAFATIIGTFINHRYKDILRRINWNSLNPDYALTATSASTVPSASTYTLPSDFGKEMYVLNTGTNDLIPRVELDRLAIEQTTYLQSTGTIESYDVFETKDSTAASAEASAARIKRIRFWRAPSTDNHFTIPYIMYPADLSADTDELVIECETAVEYGATADAWLYKRQFAKAQQFEALYERELQNLIWNQVNQPNQVPLMNVLPLDRDDGID